MSRLLSLALLAALAGCNDTTIGTNNAAPEVVIQSPPTGWIQSVDDTLDLTGFATDLATPDDELEVSWGSSLDGVLFEGTPDDQGISTFTMIPVNPGTHVITFTAVDEAGASGTGSIEVTFTADGPPGCSITAPLDGDSFDPNRPVLIQAQVSDDITSPENLLVAWFSSTDGPLSTAQPDDFGVASDNVTLSAQDQTISIQVTDVSGNVCEDTIDIISNGPPTAPVVELLPDPPSIFEDLRAEIVQDSVDPEGTEVSYALRWLLNDIPREDLQGPTVPASELLRGQVWRVEVTAQDEAGTMALEPGTDLAVVPDTPPGALEIEVEPAEPTQASDLLCNVTVDAVDPDVGDVVSYEFTWLLDGQPTTFTGPTLSFLETEIGDQWTCVAWATDGTLDGPAEQVTVTIEEGCTALETDGAQGSVIVLDDAALRLDAGDFTVEAWVKPQGFQNNTDDAALVSKRGLGTDQGWHLAITTDGVPFFHVSIGSNPRLDATESLALDEWAHVAVVYEASAGIATMFIDGDPAGSMAMPSPSGAATHNLVFGDDGAGLSDRVFEGLIDDVRISDAARYAANFLPPSVLAADGDTVALWGFEEGAGTLVHDVTGAGHDGTVAAATFSSDSSCDLDLAPSQPVVSLDLDYPDDDDVITCALDIVSVDPEGQPVSYLGQWLVDGSPSGLSFTTFPAQLPDTLTSEGESWTCHVVASDGARDSDPGAASVWVGSEPVCMLEVTDTGTDAFELCSFEAPVPGLLRMTAVNADGSTDGSFYVDMGALGTTWIFTGFKDAAYDGDVVLPWLERDVEMNVTPAMGTLAMTLGYDAENTAASGTDTLFLDFVFHDELTTTGATELLDHQVASADSTNATYPAATGEFTIGSGERLLLEVGPCGSTGVGGHGVYASNDGVLGNDGLTRVETGDPDYCGNPLRSISIDPGTWTFSLNHEDNFWTDNTGDRGLTLYSY